MPCYQILTVTRCVTLLVNFQCIEYIYTVLRLITNCYNHQDEQDPNNPNPPVRRNPRIANSKIFDESQGGTNKQLVIMNDPGLLSLINEPLPRTPMDLIQVCIYIDTARPCPIPPLHPLLASISPCIYLSFQADFPSTPSAVYSNRIFDGLDSVASDLPDTGDLKVSSGDLRMPDPAKRTSSTNLSSMMSNNSDSSSQLALEQATKSLDQLYVSPELSSKMVQGQVSSQYRSTSSSFFGSSNPNNVPAHPQVHPSVGGSNALSAKQSSAEGLLNGSVLSVSLNNSFSNNLPKSNVPPFNSLLGSNSSPILTPLIMNASIPGAMLNINGMQQSIQGSGMQQQQPQQPTAQPAYYVQQAVYLDQNGQPMYYRPGREGHVYIVCPSHQSMYHLYYLPLSCIHVPSLVPTHHLSMYHL